MMNTLERFNWFSIMNIFLYCDDNNNVFDLF